MSDGEPAGPAPPPGGNYLASGIFYRHWVPGVPPAAVILLVHGLAEHSGRYEALARRLTDLNLAVLAPDLPGHGNSPGPRLYAEHFEALLAPLRNMRNAVDHWYPGLPCFLLGHSMGGLIALRLLLQQQARFAGALLSGPALRPPRPVSLPQQIFLRLLALLGPRIGLVRPAAALICRDPDVVRRYQDDPLVCRERVTARLLAELLRGMDQVRRERHRLQLPLLLQQGGDDKLAPTAGARDFIAGVASPDRTLHVYPGLYHEVFNEPERDRVLADLTDWLQSRLEHGREE